jgi:tetratricopeptide (TPR) repeat protein
MRCRPFAVVALASSVTLTVAFAAPQPEQHDHGAPAGRLGTVHFATSCAPAVQQEFDRGIALLHSFWFSAAIESFSTVLAGDSRCVMAHWGSAMSWWSNPFGGFRSPQALKAGLAAVDAAKVSGAGTDREKAYVAAVEHLFRDASTVDQRTRIVAYEKAMEALSATYPDDVEARIFYALALDQSALPSDKTYANQLKAAGILEQAFTRQPEHPGLAHYIIHSFDVPALAPRALDAARRYAKIAPDAAHALHMPSHTFTRVGSWEESIETNRASAAAARKDDAVAEQLHALDYQAYAYLQTGQDAAARQALDGLDALGARIDTGGAGNAAPPTAGYYAWAAIPARYALERGAWAEAAALTPHQTRFGWPDAVTHFARALGAARSGDIAAARRDIERLAAIHDTLVKAKDAYWAEQVEIQRRGAVAWVTLAEGRQVEALALMREAADMEDATEKAAVTPGPIKPARELLGEMLLQLNQPTEALAAFETTLKKEPNRFRATYGAARAAEAAGQREKASTYYASLLTIAKGADQPGRQELAEAREKSAAR